MRHEGILYGLPKEKRVSGRNEYLGDGENSEFDETDLKTHIADDVVEVFREKADGWLQRYVRQNGVGALRPLLEGKMDLEIEFRERHY
jgi:hypothetical protein